MRIGPEPTTDSFMSIMDGPHPHIVPGNALAVDPNFQFETLSRYGNNFLNKFEGSFLPNQVSCLCYYLFVYTVSVPIYTK